jgi:rhodanese-related sulfurtransferase
MSINVEMAAGDGRNMVNELYPKDAWDLLRRRPEAVLLDVRSRMEFDFVGHPPGAVHVPWQEFPGWGVDADFVAHVTERLQSARPGHAPEELPILALCRTGKRSEAAAAALAAAGYREVYNVREGFEGERDAEKHRGTINGWRHHGLPWEQT